MAFLNGCIIALAAFIQIYAFFSIFQGIFHSLFAQLVIFKSFFHFYSLHSIVLPQWLLVLYWGKSEVLEDIGSVWKRESDNGFKTNKIS